MQLQLVSDFASSIVSDHMVTLAPEGGEITFGVQRSLLLATSPWFVAALTNFRRGQDRMLRFPDTPTEVIEMFIYWMFHGFLDFPDPADRIAFPYDLPSQTILIESQTLLFVRLWIFADRHFIPRLQNLAMSCLENYTHMSRPTPPTIQEVFEQTMPHSQLREFMMKHVMRAYGFCKRVDIELAAPSLYRADAVDVIRVIPDFMEHVAEIREDRVQPPPAHEAMGIDVRETEQERLIEGHR